MSNFIFSINATLPLFLLALLGVILNRTGVLDKDFGNKCDHFIFYYTVPPAMFLSMYDMDMRTAFDLRLLGFCMAATVISILLAWGLGTIVTRGHREDLGEFIQASYRSSVALLGYALLTNIYGETTTGPVMVLGSVPLYNVAACLILVLTSPKTSKDPAKVLWEATLGVVKNPIILGIVTGSIASLLRLPVPKALLSTARSLSAMTTPLVLISIGISFEKSNAIGKAGPSFIATFCKLILGPMIFLPAAILLGFRGEALVTVLIMTGSPLAPAAYTMARKFGHEGIISGSAIMLTTMGSAVSLTIWILLLKNMGLI